MNWNEELRNIIEQTFSEQWDATPISNIDFGENNKFNVPKDGSNWCRISYTIVSVENASVGTNFQRARGILTVQCFTAEDIGEKPVNEMIGKAIGIFQNKNFNVLHCFAATPLKVGIKNNWYQKNAKIDFIYNILS